MDPYERAKMLWMNETASSLYERARALIGNFCIKCGKPSENNRGFLCEGCLTQHISQHNLIEEVKN